MTDKNPPLVEIVIEVPNENFYELRGAALLEAGAEQADVMSVKLLTAETNGHVMDRSPHMAHHYILQLNGDGNTLRMLETRQANERIVIDMSAAVLWLDQVPESYKASIGPEALAYWGSPEVQAVGRETLRRADAVMVHAEYLTEVVSDINPNVFVVKDLDREDMEHDAVRLLSDIMRVLAFASANPNYSALPVPKKSWLTRARKVIGL